MAEAEQEAAPEMEQIEEAAGGEIAVNDEEPKDLMNEDENEDANEEENEQEVAEEAEGVSGDPGDAVDTTAEFLKIFQGKTEFSSWEEFNTLFEEFQRETGSGKYFSNPLLLSLFSAVRKFHILSRRDYACPSLPFVQNLWGWSKLLYEYLHTG